MPWKIISFFRRNHATNLQNTIQITPGTKTKKKSKTVKKNPKTILHPLQAWRRWHAQIEKYQIFTFHVLERPMSGSFTFETFGLEVKGVAAAMQIYKFWFSGNNNMKFLVYFSVGFFASFGFECLIHWPWVFGDLWLKERVPENCTPLSCMNEKWHVCPRKVL